MKYVTLTTLVIALMTSAVFAEDTDTSQSVELKLSKTLTLNPSGEAPVVVAPAPTKPPTAAVESSSSALPWIGLLALVALPVGYWLGTRRQKNILDETVATQSTLNDQIVTLKEALIESGSGPRDEWQSSLTSLQSELREKSKYIDRLHDQGTANSELLTEVEEALQQQVEATESLKTEHQTTLSEEVGRVQKQLDAESQSSAKKLEEQEQRAQQQLDELTEQSKQTIEAQSEELNKRLSDQSSSARKELDGLKSLNKKIITERDDVQQALKQSESSLEELRNDHARLTSELESAVSALGPQTAQIKQLSTELDELQSSNDASVAELKKYIEQNSSLTKELDSSHEENKQSLKLLEEEKQSAKKQLLEEQQKLGANFEAEKLALTQTTNQKTEELNDNVIQLEQSLKERSEELEKLKADFKEQIADEREKFNANLETQKLELNQIAEKQSSELSTKIEELEKALENREQELKTVETDFAHASSLSIATLEDRDNDLAALTEKLASLEATETALDQLNQAHSGALAELKAATEHVTKLEDVLQKSKTQLDQLDAVNIELGKKDAELAQIQSIAVDTEQALNEARAALSDQAKALENNAQSAESVTAENVARLEEIAQLNTKLADVTQRAEQEAQRAAKAQEAQQALEDKLIHQEQDTSLLLDNLKALEAEHKRQNEMVSKLESSVEQLEADLNEREEENTATLKQLALVTDKSAELAAKADDKDLLDTHIQELEAQLISEQEQRNETTATQKLLVEKRDMHAAELERELKALKLTVNNQAQANDHLKKTLDQARKYREELEENTRDLERENRELSKAGTKTRQELQVADQALQDSNQKISDRDQKMQHLQTELESKSSELASSKAELGNLFNKVDELTASVALMESNSDDANSKELSEKLDRTRRELNSNVQLLSETTAARDEQERNVTALQEQLARSQESLERKTARANTLGSQLIELSEQRDKNLDTIASLQQALDAVADSPPSQPAVVNTNVVTPDEDYEEAMRARENIIGALEQELQNADIKIAGLNQKLEDSQMAARAETRVDKPADEPISSAELEKLKLALMEKTRLIQTLSNDVKVNKDLVKVFENDSNMLHDTEVKLESLEEHSQFLEHELAKAVTENKTLKSEIEKAAKRLARHQNIGRTVSEDTRLEQMRSRLSLLESENRQQLEVIAQLRGLQDRPG